MRQALVAFLLGIGLCACSSTSAKSSAGFRLPDGNIEKGLAAFVELKCHACHTVVGAKLPAAEKAAATVVVLGGETRRVRTYGELVTSIINPSHRLAQGYPKDLIQVNGRSLMKDHNDVMTVQQMIDLVAFLQSHYQLVMPPVVR